VAPVARGVADRLEYWPVHNLDVTWPWTDDDLHSNFRIAPGDTVARIVADYVEECANSRRAIVDADLDDSARGEGMDFTLRYAMLHMIQETARHCGHLDLLREATDGAVGM
jgi:Protein of unknown function (DUF664)